MFAFSLNNNTIEIIGITNNITKAGSHKISKIAPNKAKRFTFTSLPSIQYPDTMMLNKKIDLLVFEWC